MIPNVLYRDAGLETSSHLGGWWTQHVFPFNADAQLAPFHLNQDGGATSFAQLLLSISATE